MASASDQAFLMKGYLRGGGPPMLLVSLFLLGRADVVSHLGEVVRRKTVMAAAEEGAWCTPLCQGPHEEAWKL